MIIRRENGAHARMGLSGLASDGRMSQSALEVLQSALRERHGVLICGTLASGKSTLVSALLAESGSIKSLSGQRAGRVVLVECDPDVHVPRGWSVWRPSRNADLSLLVNRGFVAHADHFVVDGVMGLEARAVLRAAASGVARGTIATIYANSVEKGIMRFQHLASLGASRRVSRADVIEAFPVVVLMEARQQQPRVREVFRAFETVEIASEERACV